MTALPPDATVLVVDDHELVGTSLVLGLRSEGTAAHRCRPRGGPEQVLAAAAELSPGLVLLDLDLGRDAAGRRIDGLPLVQPLIAAGWRVLILSGTSDHTRVGGALAAGALGWVSKSAPFPRPAARRARSAGRPGDHAGRPAVGSWSRGTWPGRRSAASLLAKLDRLTQREREVLARLADGQRAQAVADHFVVSLATVRTQIRAVLTKLEVGSQLEAVALYRRTIER